MKNNSNIISSCVVALLAGVIYYILSEPVSFQKTAGNQTWGEDNIEKVTASVIPGEARGDGNAVVDDSFQKVTYKKKYSRTDIHKVSAKKYNRKQNNVIAETKKRNDGIQYASSTLWLDDNFIIDNNTDFQVSVVNENGETHIVIKGKGDCKSKNTNNKKTKNGDKIAGNDMIRDDNECKIVIKKRDDSDKNGFKRTKSIIRASVPDTDPVAGEDKKNSFKFGTEGSEEVK